MQKRVAELFWWPGWAKKTEDFVKGYAVRIKVDRTQRSFQLRWLRWTYRENLGTRFLSILNDLLISKRTIFFICCMDYYSKWPESYPIK